MKDFKTNVIDTVKVCQDYFDFDFLSNWKATTEIFGASLYT